MQLTETQINILKALAKSDLVILQQYDRDIGELALHGFVYITLEHKYSITTKGKEYLKRKANMILRIVDEMPSTSVTIHDIETKTIFKYRDDIYFKLSNDQAANGSRFNAVCLSDGRLVIFNHEQITVCSATLTLK